MKKIAILFPGQGAQYIGMGKDFAESFACARETFEEADEILKMRLSNIIFEGPEDLLMQTKNSQLAIFVTSMALWRVLQSQMPHLHPFVFSGLSLGEYSALCASGKISFKDAVLLIQKRSQFMQEAAEKMGGAMSAVLGLDAEVVLLALQGLKDVWVANYNCPGQIVISGTKEGVEKGSEVLKSKGAKRVIPLSVSGAFHSPLMMSAKTSLEPYIMVTPIQETPIRFVMNVVGDFVENVSDIRQHLVSQVTDSVRWQQGVLAMQKQQVDVYLEIGPGKTLSGMNRKMGISGQIVSLDSLKDLDQVVSQLEAQCNC